MEYGRKIRAIREAEGLTQPALAMECGLPLSCIEGIELGGNKTELETIEKLIKNERIAKYTLWLMIGKTTESAGQISPALSHSGREKIN
ncbi:helix-turn-helix domain-containing protein [Lonsdalea quercina]|uniref:helix-turn-helix domain-containing protein n=1 Tax=Lonsdalea quercina TaxID=71657 RepID=UPI003974A7D4